MACEDNIARLEEVFLLSEKKNYFIGELFVRWKICWPTLGRSTPSEFGKDL